jgi:methyl-accepting chemotaxis protein
MNNTFNFLIALLIFNSLITNTETVSLKKSKNTIKKVKIIDKISGFANSATSMLGNISSSGQIVQKQLAPVKEYYVQLEGVLGNFKQFLANQTSVVTPSILDSESSFKTIETKFTQISDMAKTINETVSSVGSLLPSNEYSEKLKTVTNQVNDISQGVNKFKGYANNINDIIKSINDKFNVMKEFDDTKIVELRNFIGEFDNISKDLESANSYVNDLMSVSSKVSNISSTLEDAKNKVSGFFGKDNSKTSSDNSSTSGSTMLKYVVSYVLVGLFLI